MQSLRLQQGRNRRMAASARCAGWRSAFTMIELVIVLLIMGIMTALTAPTFYDSLLFHRVESAARRVKADLDLARTQARLTSTNKTVTFANSKYTISNTKSLDNANYVYTVDLKLAPYALDSATANFSNLAAVSFDGYGGPSSGGTVEVVAKAHKCTLTLDGTTGEITITSSHTGGRVSQTQSTTN